MRANECKRTPEQWDRLKQQVLHRARAARAQALRDVAGGILAAGLQLAAGARRVLGNLRKAYAVRRERKAAIRALWLLPL